MNNVYIEAQQCTHGLCIEGTRKWDAKYLVTKTLSNGNQIVTYACAAHAELLRPIVGQSGTFVEL